MYTFKAFLFFCGLFCIHSAKIKTSPKAEIFSYINLYEGYNFDGRLFDSYQAADDLSNKDFDNKTHSILFNGIWLLYEHDHFNRDARGLVVWRTGTEIQEVLSDSGLGGKLSSVRPVGAVWEQSWETPSLNLFHGVNFTAEASIPFYDNEAVLSFTKPASLIIVGKGVSWTFYNEINFGGKGHCLTTTELVNFYPNFEVVGVDLSSAVSVEQGCWARHGVPLNSP